MIILKSPPTINGRDSVKHVLTNSARKRSLCSCCATLYTATRVWSTWLIKRLFILIDMCCSLSSQLYKMYLGSMYYSTIRDCTEWSKLLFPYTLCSASTSQQYFSLTPNQHQPSASASQQYFFHNKLAPATSHS